ncbi:MAG TPA: hypothetical protein VH256_05405 [Thermoleophilaceae bacterium]|jgi:hypothetical protein|nr:hypothetical protein [Thermoleophilaceae bacterium]
MRRVAAVSAALACAALAGCGGTSGDILGLGISGGPRNQTLHMHVTEDGRGSCNNGPLRTLPSKTIIQARTLVRDAEPLSKQSESLGERTPGRRNLELRTPDGTTMWVEGTAGLPPVLPRAEQLALDLSRDLC